MASSKPRPSTGADPTTGAVAAVAAVAAILAIAAQVLGTLAGFGSRFIATSFGLYLAASVLIVRGLRGHHEHARFGLANCVTLLRVALVCLMAGITVDAATRPMILSDQQTWTLFALAFTAMMLDGADGIAARRFGTLSGYGARFDMEVDAFQILVLSAAAAITGKAGVWVLASGFMRYAAVGAGFAWPVLATPVPFSWRRKTIAVIQGGALTAITAPVVLPPASDTIAAVALLLLVYSFTVDIRWQLAHRGRP
ncbi:MAG: CDP-alcohol phosphatidyltransferase family protein [Candidatus Binataceae bacterium]